MEQIAIILDKPEKFDEKLRNSLPDGGDLEVITKENATVSGAPAVMLTFTVELPDGTFATAQTVTTVKLLQTVLAVLECKYGGLE